MAAGLRDLHKGKTRATLSTAAMRLFAESGFDDVTITQIADAARVSKMTVTNYFPRKEDLVFDQADETIQSLARAVATRPPGSSLLDAVRRDCDERIAAHDTTLGPPGYDFAKIVHDSRVLTNRAREIADLREQALADAIASETGVDNLQQRVAAAQLATVHRALFTETSKRVLHGESRDAIFRELADLAPRLFDTLRPGLDHYLVRPDRPSTASQKDD